MFRFLATSGIMKDVEHPKKATMKRMKIQYLGKGIYFSLETPLPSSCQIIMTINSFTKTDLCCIFAL